MDQKDEIVDNQEMQEWIDAYLMDRLDSQDRARFVKRMEMDPDFRLSVKKQREIMFGVEAHNLQHAMEDFHANIEDEPQNKWLSPGRLALVASLLILLGVSTWAVITKGKSPHTVFASNFSPDPGLPTTMGTASDYNFYHGMVNYKRKEYVEAIKRWEPLYAAHPNNDTLAYFLGVANLAQGHAQQAKKYLLAVKEASESVFYEEIKHYLALALLKQNKIAEAKETLAGSTSAANKVLLKEIEVLNEQVLKWYQYL